MDLNHTVDLANGYRLLAQSAQAATQMLPMAERELNLAKAKVNALKTLISTIQPTSEPDVIDKVLRDHGPLRFKEIKEKVPALAVSSIYAKLGKGKKSGKYVNHDGLWQLG